MASGTAPHEEVTVVERPTGDVQEVLVPVPAADPADRGLQVAARLAAATGCRVRLVHVRPPGGPEPDGAALVRHLEGDNPRASVTWEVVDGDDVAAAVLGLAGAGSLIVMATRRANRWSGKDSISEHVLDRWSGATMLVGPTVEVDRQPAGDVLVGLDGSPTAERALPLARSLAECLGADLVLARVAGAEDSEPAPGAAPRADEAAAYLASVASGCGAGTAYRLLRSNDAISALADAASVSGCGLIVLSSRGDRSSRRATISRVSTGLAAVAAQPVVVLGTHLDDGGGA